MPETENPIERLPTLQRLALAYAPRHAHTATLGLLLLDDRLGGIVRRASEPMLAQIKLAWWRDTLSRSPADWPKGEPLLALLRHWNGCAVRLGGLVDGWEMCISGEGDLDGQAIEGLAKARGAAFGSLAGLLGHPEAARAALQMGGNWALADLAAHLPDPEDRKTARLLMAGAAWTQRHLPRAMRPLAVLHGLAARSARKGIGIDQLTAASLAPAMRIGLFGR